MIIKLSDKERKLLETIRSYILSYDQDTRKLGFGLFQTNFENVLDYYVHYNHRNKIVLDVDKLKPIIYWTKFSVRRVFECDEICYVNHITFNASMSLSCTIINLILNEENCFTNGY